MDANKELNTMCFAGSVAFRLNASLHFTILDPQRTRMWIHSIRWRGTFRGRLRGFGFKEKVMLPNV